MEKTTKALTNWPIYKSCGQNYIFGVLNSTLLGLAKQTTFDSPKQYGGLLNFWFLGLIEC